MIQLLRQQIRLSVDRAARALAPRRPAEPPTRCGLPQEFKKKAPRPVHHVSSILRLAAMPPPSTITPAGFLSVAPLLASIVAAALIQLVTYPFRAVRSPALYNDVLYGAVRCMLDRITIAHSRYLHPSTSARYTAHCKKQQVEPKTLRIQARDCGDIAAHWIGSPDAEMVVLYCHGGGYTQPANQGVYNYLERLVKDLNSEQQCCSVAVLILAYTLAPEASHPTQLREAAALLSHLLDASRSPSNIFLAGDSAGGNLVLAVLSHLLYPHPDVPIVKLAKPLAGALMYSPWAGFRTDFPSFANESLDMLSPLALRKWAAMFLNQANPANPEADPGPVSGDAWTEPCLNPASWWSGLHNIVGDILVAYGSFEVLASSIKKLEHGVKSGWVEGGGAIERVVFIEGPQQAHIAPIVDIMTPAGLKKSDTQIAIEEWLNARLQKS